MSDRSHGSQYRDFGTHGGSAVSEHEHKVLILFIPLGVVMLTVMVCCFLVFGVQKGDENVLNSARRR